MIPHHEGAVEMAKVLLRYGQDPELRKLGENVDRTQTEEILQMIGCFGRRVSDAAGARMTNARGAMAPSRVAAAIPRLFDPARIERRSLADESASFVPVNGGLAVERAAGGRFGEK